jgi:glycyl-tRNA synthetase
MFGTKLGASADTAMDLYLRPETAQGIFVNFLNVQKIRTNESSFGIAQTGKAFRERLLQVGNLFFVCVNLNRWKCSFFASGDDEMKHYEFWKEALEMALILGTGRKLSFS